MSPCRRMFLQSGGQWLGTRKSSSRRRKLEGHSGLRGLVVDKDRETLSAAERVGVGVRGARGYHDPIPLGRRPGTEPSELQTLRRSIGRFENPAGGFVSFESIRIVRRARQRMGVGRGLLAQELCECSIGWKRVGHSGKLRAPHTAGRLVERRSPQCAFGGAQPIRSRHPQRQHRISSRQDVRISIRTLTSP